MLESLGIDQNVLAPVRECSVHEVTPLASEARGHPATPSQELGPTHWLQSLVPFCPSLKPC